MSKQVTYKGFVIQSSPIPLQGGGYSAHGFLINHQGSGSSYTPFDSSTAYQTEEEADEAFIRAIVDHIDKNRLP